MNIKSWFKYLIYLLLILAMVYLNISKFFSFYNKINFTYNYFHLFINTFSGILIGVLLGSENFYKEYKREGVWKINVPKLIVIGLPSLYLAFTYILLFTRIPVLSKLVLNTSSYLLNLGTDKYILFFQLILGYVIITSFYRTNVSKGNDNNNL